MAQRNAQLDWLIFVALGIAWGSSYLFIKIGVETLAPFTLVASRLAIGTAVLALVLRLSRQGLPRRRSVYGHLVVVALLGIVIPFSLITWGEQSIDSALAAILNGSVPLFVQNGDERYDVDAGAADDDAIWSATFDYPGRTVEWRLRQGRPFAIIYRLVPANPEARGVVSTLMVETVGTKAHPGCRVAMIAGSAKDANARSRAAADRILLARPPCLKPQ